MTKLPSPEAVKYHSSRLSIAETAGLIWRIGAEQDLKKEDTPQNFPKSLARFFPASLDFFSGENIFYRSETHLGSIHPAPETLLQEWVDARADLWTPLPAETKPLRNWLKQLQPPCSLNTSSIQKYWKQHRDQLPFKPKDCNLRKLLDMPLEVSLHQGYVHNALIQRRVRENGFICWRHASSEGLRGIDIAPFLSPKNQPLDVQLHMLKWAWKHDAIKLAHTLFEMGLIQSKAEKSTITLENYHPAISKSQLLGILGIQEGTQNISKIGRALYRAKKLNIGKMPILLQTNPAIKPIKDSAFFLPRKRRPQELFSRWNQGIQVDEQGRYSITPERHALAIAKQVQAPIVLDAFSGCGGNAIAFARQPHIQKVIAFELDKTRYRMAKNNGAIYNVGSKIEFYQGSVLKKLPPAPFVFLDPPWEWGEQKIELIRKQFQLKYPHGMMKLPISFPFPQNSQVTLYLTEENYPSFAILQW